MANLYYVIGASGAGKDSVLGYVKERIQETDRIVFAHRYITRHRDAGGESHVPLTPLEFEMRRKAGCFCMHWDSHGYRYGIGFEVEAWLEADCDVVVNGSRAYLEKALVRFPELEAVNIVVSPEVLRDRLVRRGRETLDEIEKRIRRTDEIEYDQSNLWQLSNDGPLEEAGEAFFQRIRSRSGVAVLG